MTYLASAGAVIATWIGRANQAWGTSRSWSVGSSFETDLTNMTGSRDYWQHTVAHNDPDVWNTRYNAGYAQADLVESPRALTQSTFTVAAQSGAGASSFSPLQLTPSSDAMGVWVGSNTLRLRAGSWYIRVTGRFNGSGTARFRILQSGAPLRTSQAGPDATNNGDCAEWVSVGGNTDYTFQMAADGAVSLVAGGIVSAMFMPTPSAPQ